MTRLHSRIARLALVVACAGCHRTRPMVAEPVPACPPPVVDTTGWRVYDAGAFSMLLPRSAHALPVQCIDSLCGTVAIRHWRIEYESGGMSGHTIDSLPLVNTDDEHDCVLHVGQREWHASVFNKGRGLVGGYATLLHWPHGRMTLLMEGRRMSDVAQFFTAMRTIRVR